MTPRHSVRISNDTHVFCAAHFITYDGKHCERLHGHNYRMTASISGPLDENHYVFDFIAMRNHLKAMSDALDHRMLVPTKSLLIHCEATDQQVTLRFEKRTWSFPREDCVLLPLANTTSEMLAQYLGENLYDWLLEKNYQPDCIKMELEESCGMTAIYEWHRG